MKNTIFVLLLSVLLCSVGCATKGRMSLIDLDLRTPEQITAYQQESHDVYAFNTPTNAENVIVEPKSIPAPTWDIIVKIVEVFKGRIKILSFEWKD